MEEILLKLLSDFVFAAVLLVLYRESLRRNEEQVSFLRDHIKQQWMQAEKSFSWYQQTISSFMKGAARV